MVSYLEKHAPGASSESCSREDSLLDWDSWILTESYYEKDVLGVNFERFHRKDSLLDLGFDFWILTESYCEKDVLAGSFERCSLLYRLPLPGCIQEGLT